MLEEVVLFWFRRDLRLEDNAGLWHALSSGNKVIPLFIYDRNILERLESQDRRISLIADLIDNLSIKLRAAGSGLYSAYGNPLEVFKTILSKYNVKAVYANRDYEPYAVKRDKEVGDFLESNSIHLYTFKDHAIFEMSDIAKDDGKPYTVYTPYSVKWLKMFHPSMMADIPSVSLLQNFMKFTEDHSFPIQSLGFKMSPVIIKAFNLSEELLLRYNITRDIPSEEGTSLVSPHLRFGTISIREIMRKSYGINQTYTKELIWREFFMQILYHFPQVVENSFRPAYDRINWLNSEEHFDRWCTGTTGFPLVDAGMRELDQTGYMHNRVRMIAANFLTKHLLTDWRWGESWFSGRLNDYELSSNNGNWQWAAGTGCDAAPYFRIFNHDIQIKKFDPQFKYITRWIPEFGTPDYPSPIVDQHTARERAIKYYKAGLYL